ncbi:MAG: hypothetical protein A2Y37_06345 [Spirochaetes bacterium GWB1_60_80]|nr:MAG: hypothetical protein A2Y37_06345 [Spirochaetes bacterium GWB1_60_80]
MRGIVKVVEKATGFFNNLLNTLPGFIDAYQSVTIPTLGEPWAIPLMLRLALLENLRRVAVRIFAERQAQAKAALEANRMIAVAESEPQNLILLIAAMARSDPPHGERLRCRISPPAAG